MKQNRPFCCTTQANSCQEVLPIDTPIGILDIAHAPSAWSRSGASAGLGEKDVPKYRAFLSYSHRDTAWAKWLHKALEGYRVDKDLVGRETPWGPVPKALRPIFRDREDFSAGHSLTEQTIAALEASRFLIVICSPNAACSSYINEEIRCFKALGRGACVLPVIIDGEPGNAQQECFPPALRFKLDATGALTGEREEPIAADARPEGDGREIAKRKLVAGLLGVRLDEIMRRAERARKRRNRLRIGTASLAALLVLGVAFGWWNHNFLFAQLRIEEDVNSARDAADICEHANGLAVAEVWHIALALECVETFHQVLLNLPRTTRLPERVISAFETSLTFLQKMEKEDKLTSEQSALLHDAMKLAEQFGER